MTIEKASLVKVGVLRNDDEAVLLCIIPYRAIQRLLQPNATNVCRSRKLVGERLHQTMTEVLIKQELHWGGIETSLRSRSAANSRHARMSAVVNSGKSSRICSWVIPEARYSSTS